ncbi:protein JINGUBANG-like [Malus sylvestris]|uniref:protein JINGUBANG-like n=1 Tax=Malus sylvestris TaxID=3752 RepID=UPI0021AC2AB8|nr:protein JINGUBANG-like [Malus sylvestris]
MECNSSYQYSGNDLYDQSEFPYLSSEPSLQSVPSLTSQSHRQHSFPSNNYHHCLTTLQGHNSYISSLTLAGNFIYTGSSDREIRSWRCNPLLEFDNENPTQHDRNMVAAGKGAVKSLAISGDKLFSAHQDHKIRVWKIDSQEPDFRKCSRLATLPTLGDRASKLLMPKNHVQIRRHKKCTWVHHVDAVSALALSSDELLLYSVSWDRTLKVWSTTDFKCLESVTNAHDDAINAVTSSNDGHVYTGSADKKIKVWKKDFGEKKHFLVATLEKHNSGVNALAMSSDGCVLYSGACDRSIVVWEKKDAGGNMEVLGALRGHTKSILCLAVVADLVCSGSADKSIRIWRGVNRSYSCLAVLEGHKGPVKCLTATIDDHCSSSDSSCVIYSGGLDCDIKVWQVFIPSEL